MTSSVVGLRRSSKALPRVKLTPKKKKVLVTVQWSDAGLIHYSFLNPSETITPAKYAQPAQQWAYFYEMHQKLQHLQPAFVNRMAPILPHDNAQPCSTQPTLQKSNKSGYKVLPHLLYSLDLLPTNYHCFKPSRQLFARKMLPQPAGRRKRFPRVRWIPKHRFLCYRNKQTYFSLAKMCWL